MNPIGG